MSIFYLAVAASAVILIPAPEDSPRQARVDYSDLDLSSSSGQSTLDRRLKTAMNMVCGRTQEQPPYFRRAVVKCQQRTMADIGPKRDLAIARTGVKLATGY
jgi:UrcA family protein